MHDVGPQGPLHAPSSWRAALVRVSFACIGPLDRDAAHACRGEARLAVASERRGGRASPAQGAQVWRVHMRLSLRRRIRALVVGTVCVFAHSATLVAGYPLARLVFATTALLACYSCSVAPHRRLLGLPARAPPCSLRSERSCSLAAQRNAPASFATAAASPLEYHVRAIGTMFQLVSAVLGRRWGGPRPAGPAMGRNHSRRCSGGTS